MATFLVVKNGTMTKSYTCKDSANKPYIKVSNAYLPLTTQTGTGLHVKASGSTFIPQASYTTTTTVTQYYAERGTFTDTRTFACSRSFTGYFYSSSQYGNRVSSTRTFSVIRTYNLTFPDNQDTDYYGVEWNYDNVSQSFLKYDYKVGTYTVNYGTSTAYSSRIICGTGSNAFRFYGTQHSSLTVNYRYTAQMYQSGTSKSFGGYLITNSKLFSLVTRLSIRGVGADGGIQTATAYANISSIWFSGGFGFWKSSYISSSSSHITATVSYTTERTSISSNETYSLSRTLSEAGTVTITVE